MRCDIGKRCSARRSFAPRHFFYSWRPKLGQRYPQLGVLAVHGSKHNRQLDTVDKEPLRVLELFSGIGGFHYALQRVVPASWRLHVQAVDINTVANDVYEFNFGVRPRPLNLDQVTAAALDEFGAQLWCLSPPCQPYTRTLNSRQRDASDPRARSLLRILEVLPRMARPPDALILENVEGFIGGEVHSQLLDVLSGCSYITQEFTVSPHQLGVPYLRARYWALAKRQTPPAAMQPAVPTAAQQAVPQAVQQPLQQALPQGPPQPLHAAQSASAAGQHAATRLWGQHFGVPTYDGRVVCHPPELAPEEQHRALAGSLLGRHLRARQLRRLRQGGGGQGGGSEQQPGPLASTSDRLGEGDECGGAQGSAVAGQRHQQGHQRRGSFQRGGRPGQPGPTGASSGRSSSSSSSGSNGSSDSSSSGSNGSSDSSSSDTASGSTSGSSLASMGCREPGESASALPLPAASTSLPLFALFGHSSFPSSSSSSLYPSSSPSSFPSSPSPFSPASFSSCSFSSSSSSSPSSPPSSPSSSPFSWPPCSFPGSLPLHAVTGDCLPLGCFLEHGDGGTAASDKAVESDEREAERWRQHAVPTRQVAKFWKVLDVVTADSTHANCVTKSYAREGGLMASGSVLASTELARRLCAVDARGRMHFAQDPTTAAAAGREAVGERSRTHFQQAPITVAAAGRQVEGGLAVGDASCLAAMPVESEAAPLRLRFLTPREVANLHGLPPAKGGGSSAAGPSQPLRPLPGLGPSREGGCGPSDLAPCAGKGATGEHQDTSHRAGFALPPGLADRQAYALLGNSLSVDVAALLLCYLLSSPKA